MTRTKKFKKKYYYLLTNMETTVKEKNIFQNISEGDKQMSEYCFGLLLLFFFFFSFDSSLFTSVSFCFLLSLLI